MKMLMPSSTRNTWRLVDDKDVNFVNRLVALKQKHSAFRKAGIEHFWPVMDEIIKWWRKRNPQRWESYIMTIEKERVRQDVPKWADNSKNRERTGAKLRYLVDIPQPIVLILRRLYNVDELPMNKDFWKEVWKRYPVFRIPEKF